MPEDRRHAVLLFTDIGGYAALMGLNEYQATPAYQVNPNIYKILINSPNRLLNKVTVIGSLIYGKTKVVNSSAR